MLKPNTDIIATAGKFVTEATAKQQSGDLRGAQKSFSSAANLLKSELDRLSLESKISTIQVDPAQFNFVNQYIQQLSAQSAALETAIEKQIHDIIRERRKEVENKTSENNNNNNNNNEVNHGAATASETPPSNNNDSSTNNTASDLFGGISIPKHTLDPKKLPAPSSTTAPVSSPNPPSKPPATTSTPSSTHVNNNLNVPSKRLLNTSELDKLAFGQSAPGSSAIPTSNYAPRASDIVYRAIEHATKLAASHQYKTAADIIQHAYEVGCREDHKPKNLEKLPQFAKDLRLKYHGKFPPRIPQDNARTADEEEVLRSAGRTTRMLLSEWDDVDEGYVAENIWMPGRSDQPYQDDFVPRMAPDQMKWKPRYLRFSDVMAYHEKFDELVNKKKPAEIKQNDDTSGDVAVPGEGSTNNTAEIDPSQSQPPQTSQIAIISSLPDPMTIKQTVVSDCSLVCSLIVTANYERRFPGSRLIRSAVFPQDDTTGEPIVNKKGKYCIKMLVNGTTRVIAVDDRFPAAGCEEITPQMTKIREPELLCSQTVTRGEMWVSLMEKAFIKVSGGSYDFPGSNSSNDLYRLSGWLPDVLRFPNTGQQYGANFDHEDAAGSREKPFDADLQWRRLSTCHSRGAVVLTIATPSQLPAVVEERLKLIPGHAYAVLDFKEVSAGYRLVKVKNPWSSQPWEGLFGINDTRRVTPEMMQELNHSKEENEQGVFWTKWEDVVTFFAVAHLSWNPYSLFASPNPSQQKYFRPTRLARHAKNISTTSGGGEAPQFQIYIPPWALSNNNNNNNAAKRRLHLVLSRHITNDAEYEENELITHANGQKRYEAPFITVHVYDTTSLPSLAAQCRSTSGGGDQELWRNRMASLDGNAGAGGRRLKSTFETDLVPCLHRGIYSNSAATTHSFDCPGGPRELTCIVARLPQSSASSSSGSFEPFSFSMTLYSNIPFDKNNNTCGFNFLPMPPLKSSLRNRCVVPGEWISGQNCGGAPGGQTFTFNPQFTFVLRQDSHILSELLSPIDCAVNVIICKVKDDGDKWFEDLNSNPAWCIRADLLSDTKHPLVMFAPRSSKFGSCVDSSLADCIRIGDQARAPPLPVQSNSNNNNNNNAAPNLNETTDPNAPPSSSTAPPKKAFTKIHQLIHSLNLDVKIPTAHGPTSAFTAPFKDQLYLAHAVANCPVSTWLVPLLLSKGQLCSHVNPALDNNNNNIGAGGLSKVVCGGTQITWSNVLNQNYLQEASSYLETLTLIVIPSCESLPRTNELSLIERNLVALASTAMDILKIGNNNAEKNTNFSSGASGVNETIEKQILALDGCACTTNEIKQTRAVLVRAAQEIHKLLDFALKNAAPAYQQTPAVSSPASPAAAAAALPENSPKENPLRSILTIPPGRYVVIAAAQEKGKPGPFSISLECEEEPVELRPLPAEGAGWRCPNLTLTSAWIGDSAAGPPQGDQGWTRFRKNPTVLVSVGGNAQMNKGLSPAQKLRVFCRLIALAPPGSAPTAKTPSMQLMMFKNAVSDDNLMAHSGKYSSQAVVLKSAIEDDSIFGVPVDFGTEYHIVMSTYDGAKDSGWKCALKLFVSNDNKGVVNAKMC